MVEVVLPTIHITDTGRDPVQDPDEMVSLPKSNHNTFPIPPLVIIVMYSIMTLHMLQAQP
eukprot:13935983-Ditylum_brightwellii.AAC.1